MIAFSSQATNQLQILYDDLGIAQNNKIGWVNGAKQKVHKAVIAGAHTVTIMPGLTVSCSVEENGTALTVKTISRI